MDIALVEREHARAAFVSQDPSEPQTQPQGAGAGASGWTRRQVDKRGVPFVSLIFCFAIGMLVFLPFPSWAGLVSLVTSATVLMYAMAPVSLAALRRSDPDRPRPYRLPAAKILAPLSFVCANFIVYWSG